MIHVYKQSKHPMNPFDMVRVGGANNIAPDVKCKFLVLMRVDVLQRDGEWGYLFEFDTRESLQMSELARLMTGSAEILQYKNAADWKTYLGEGWKRVNEKERWELLHPTEQPGNGKSTITNVRLAGTNRPLPED